MIKMKQNFVQNVQKVDLQNVQYPGVLRVMNTSVASTPYGNSAVALSSGSAVLSYEATMEYRNSEPDSRSWVAVTNHHVVGSASHVTCNFAFDLRPVRASVYKINPTNDLAFLLMPIPSEIIGNVDENKFLVRGYDGPVNELDVSVVGYPLGVECQTVSKGSIISQNTLCGNFVIESDCLCNGGNSGGGMFYQGKLVGINTAIMNPGNVVTISKPWSTVKSLITYIKHKPSPHFKVFNLSPREEHVLRGMYTSSLHPEKACKIWSEHCDVSFVNWFTAPCNAKLIPTVLHLVEHNPSRLQAVIDGADVAHDSLQTSPYGPELIVFDSYFKVSNTLTQTPDMHLVYPCLKKQNACTGVMISEVGIHEDKLNVGDILLAINDNAVSNYAKLPDGLPYYTAFKRFPGSPVRLSIARQGNPDPITVMYRYDRIKEANLPRIHSSVLTPFDIHPSINLRGLTVTQLTLDRAMEYGHTKYSTVDFHNDLVFVVQAVHPNTAEWHLQRITPGSLLTHIDFKPLCEHGKNDMEVWEYVQNKMSAEGVQHFTATFECRGIDGMKKVHNVYAIANAVSVTPVDHICELCG